MPNIVAAQRDVFPSLFSPFRGDESRKLIVALRSGGVGFGGERAMPFARFVGGGYRLKGRFELVFGGGVRRRKSEYRGGLR